MGENRQSITMVLTEDYDELQARYDALEAQLKDIKRTAREECAALVGELMKQDRWNDHALAMVALKVAAETVRSGRLLIMNETGGSLRSLAYQKASERQRKWIVNVLVDRDDAA